MECCSPFGAFTMINLTFAGILVGLSFLTAFMFQLLKTYGKGVDRFMRLEVFLTRQQANLMSIARHHTYNSNRVLVRLITNEKPDARFLGKLLTSDDTLMELEKDAHLFSEFPKELLYRVEHLILLIRSVNIDAGRDHDDKNQEIYYRRMFRRFMTIAVLADSIEHYMDSSSKCSIWRAMGQTMLGKSAFIKQPKIALDTKISEVETLDYDTCIGMYNKYINDRHLEQLEGDIRDHIVRVLTYAPRKIAKRPD